MMRSFLVSKYYLLTSTKFYHIFYFSENFRDENSHGLLVTKRSWKKLALVAFGWVHHFVTNFLINYLRTPGFYNFVRNLPDCFCETFPFVVKKSLILITIITQF